MRSLTTQAVILGHKNFGEQDKLIFLYTKALGKIKAIAKGSRRIISKFTGHLETLNTSTVSLYFGPKNIILTEIVSDRNHQNIRNNFDKLSNGLKIAEITNRLLFENQEIPDLIPLLENSIRHLSKTSKPDLIAIAYIIKLLDKSGLLPDFKTLNTKLEQKYLKFFNFIQKNNLNDIEKISISKEENLKIGDFIKNILEYQLGDNFNLKI